MRQVILDVTNLDKRFGGIHVTRSLDFSLFSGEQSAIIGPNGAGKSTFFNLLTGYHRADSGSVSFDGKDVTNWPPHRIVSAGMSRAFQVSNIFSRLTVAENIRTAVQATHGVLMSFFVPASNFGGEEIERILTLCGLAEKSRVCAGDLAQGDKKKLELAIAVAGRPTLLLLDEPTAGMSVQETKETMDLVDRLNQDLGITVLFTEHDMGVVFNHAERVSLLHRGQLMLTGKPNEVRKNKTVKSVYLGEGV